MKQVVKAVCLLPILAAPLFLVACEGKARSEDKLREAVEVKGQKTAIAGKGDMSMDTVARDYVALVLELGNHDKSYVDAYYGPAQWREQAEQSPASPADIAKRGNALIALLPEEGVADGSLDGLRLHYLRTQLAALVAHARSLAGESERNFAKEARELYDTEPPRQNFTSFDPFLQELDELLPGNEPLSARVQAFRQQYEIPVDKLQEVFDAAIAECRKRTKQYIPLPQDENFALEYVSDKPWSGYNWYQGGAHSLIQVNSGLPITIDRAIDLGCHEGYPGHHTYNALLEQTLVEDRGWVEYSVYPLFSPQSLIAEGSANYGIDLAFPGEEKNRFEMEVLYPLAGLDPQSAQNYERVMGLVDKLSFAGNEIARQYIDGEIAPEQVAVLFEKYTLMSPAKAKQRKDFVDAYGAYVINYNWGKKLVADYVERDTNSAQERWQRFAKLLSSPRLPSSLDW
ncbi:hypothetical protein MJO52_06040 [Microbulbifer variabilis]|uniref:DUF885 domain-containing protein n=1 Tax=Microbulbifer variabilis TaxID=266805 RepID=A0ABY4VEH9_9GAMM|nr:hypothetical protein [Microbulbifer variabilis]USD22693.1 hypothetical protein MJO52_06040 [Microbulbifer variabilis]